MIPSLKVQRPWTAEDDADRAAAEAEEARKQDIERRLGEAGYARDRIVDKGDFSWRGDRLAISPELTEDLLAQAGY